MVAEVLHNNWIKWGFDNNYDFSFRTNKKQKYSLQLSKCSRAIKSYKDESIASAKLIYEKASANNQDIWISNSGGIDSEYTARIFLEAGIPFKIATTVFKNNLNEYDVYHSRKFCQQFDLDLYEFELDIKKFLDNEMYDYAQKTACASPMFPSCFKLWDNLDGFIVAGHGDPIFKRTPNTNEWKFRVKENEDSIYRYFVWRNRQGAPGFHAYTPEMFLSFIWEENISRLFLFGHRAKVSSATGQKEQVYNKYFPMTRRSEKDGFEEIKNIDSYYRSELEKLIPGNDIFWMPIPEFIKVLWPDEMDQKPDGGNKFMPLTFQ